MAREFSDRDTDPRDSIGQPESMRNQEQRLRDGEGGSELTDLPDEHPAGVPGETASAEAAGPPPDRLAPRQREGEAGSAPKGDDDRTRQVGPGDNDNIGAPVRSAGPSESTLPEESPLRDAFQPEAPSSEENVPPAANVPPPKRGE